jgi:hypothetical protein
LYFLFLYFPPPPENIRLLGLVEGGFGCSAGGGAIIDRLSGGGAIIDRLSGLVGGGVGFSAGGGGPSFPPHPSVSGPLPRSPLGHSLPDPFPPGIYYNIHVEKNTFKNLNKYKNYSE